MLHWSTTSPTRLCEGTSPSQGNRRSFRSQRVSHASGRAREEELLYVLQKLLELQLWPGVFWAALSNSPSQYCAEQPGRCSCSHVRSAPANLDTLQRLTRPLIRPSSSPTQSRGHQRHTSSISIRCCARSFQYHGERPQHGFRPTHCPYLKTHFHLRGAQAPVAKQLVATWTTEGRLNWMRGH